jgi:hypothetical protein
MSSGLSGGRCLVGDMALRVSKVLRLWDHSPSCSLYAGPPEQCPSNQLFSLLLMWLEDPSVSGSDCRVNWTVLRNP